MLLFVERKYQMFDILYNIANFFLVQAPLTTSMPESPVNVVPGSMQVADAVVKHSPNYGLVVFEVFYVILCIAFILLVMLQTSKNEGLGAVMGGSMQNLFRGKQSVEQKLANITTTVGIVFVLSSMLICFIINRYGV